MMATCRDCPNTFEAPANVLGQAARKLCDACRRAKRCARRRNRYVRAAVRPTEEADMGPPWPLLVPPEVAKREEEKTAARMREAVADGLTDEELCARFGHGALYLMARHGIRRRPGGNGKQLPFGIPA